MRFLIALLFVATAFGQQMQDQQQQRGLSPQDIQEALRSCNECSGALRAIFTNDTLQTLPKDKPFTLLVPNNQAVMQESSLKMMSDQDKQNLVKALVLTGSHAQLKQGRLSTLAGDEQQVSGQQDSFKIGEAKVIGKFHELPGGSGYYIIDKVLMPESNQGQNQQQSGSQNDQSSSNQSQGAQATQATIQAQPSQAQPGQAQPGQVQGQAIWQLVQTDPQLSQLSQLIQQNPTLQQLLTGSLTFFLPNNNAFTQVQQRITQIPREKIADFVRHHIVYGLIPELQDGMRLATLLRGADLNVRKVGDRFTINNANVIGTFRQGANNQGYWVIDRVLFPEEAQQGQVGGQVGQPQVGAQQPPASISQ